VLSRSILFVALVGVVLAPLMVTTEKAVAAASAQIVNPVYASGLYYSGQGVTSTLQVKNSGTARDTFWIRYSVQDKAGRTYDVPATSVTLDPGKISGTISRTWTVPDPADPSELTTGFYKASFSVYDANPDTNPDAVRLDYDEKADAFRAHDFIDKFNSFNTNRWSKSDKGLGFIREQTADEVGCGTIGTAVNTLYTTYLNPDNVRVNSTGQLRIKLPATPSSNPCANLEGGEIKSTSFYKYGTYEVRMQVPNAPSSITGFFLYGGDGIAEIDIEAFNENEGKVIFTTYAENADGSPNPTPTHTTNGEPGNEPPITLPFDPTAGMHTYRVDFYPNSVKFYVDEALMKEWTDGLPSDKMQLFLNAWYPRWMSQTPPPADRYLKVDWIRH
jgi:beta-glucanase (GH16 family)